MMAGMALKAVLRSLVVGTLLLGTAAWAAGKESKVAAAQSSIQIERHFQGRELALARAAAAGEAGEVRELVQKRGADPNAVSTQGLALIAWPLLQNSVAGVEALLDNGADPNRELAGVGPAIVLAAKSVDPALLRAFIDHGGKVDAMSVNREPLIVVAQMAGRWPNVQLLVERGADIDASAHGDAKDSVLGFYSAGQFDKAEWLLQHGADPSARIEKAAKPERVGAQPIVENIYWWPVDAMRFPVLAQAQRRCQDLLARKLKLYAPAEPAHLAKLRQSQQSSQRDGDVGPLDASIGDAEARIRKQLQ
jgi:hypothetical protein